ncbi:hypothetical protein CSCA_4624 [Clostridium scatologenes]|uniref:Uncharacterized protein n=1 Tax=Clostridium scatologenes TaxID=1548 RepID=A0A0E3K473_CLOSL|nr:hypothetical protein CSCA_4624 [Clostridium scatologenes]
MKVNNIHIYSTKIILYFNEIIKYYPEIKLELKNDDRSVNL